MKFLRRSAAAAMLLALAACTPTPRVAPIPPARQIPVLLIPPPAPAVREAAPSRCLTAAEARRLRAARPTPLRLQKMPPSPAERVARTSAQLGQYEAKGAWADQVVDALDRCDGK